MALGSALRRARERHPEKSALLFEKQRWTYAALDEITDRIGAALLKDRIRPGDRVALLLPNSPELVFLYYACFKVGAVVVPLNALLQAPELGYMINHCDARLLISDATLFAGLQDLRPDLPGVEKYYVAGDASGFSGVSPFQELLGQPHVAGEFPDIADADMAAILYTSGTTARPKGVVHTHRSFEQMAKTVTDVLGFSDSGCDAVFGIAVPLFHASGIALMLVPAFSVGATAVVLPQFVPHLVLQALADHRVDCFFALPFMYNALIHCPAAATCDLSSLRYAAAGGDSVPIEINAGFRDAFGVELCETCGMTEVAPYSINPPNGLKKTGSIGLPASGMQLRLVDDVGNEVARGCVGEILVKSEATMIGYWKDTDATAQALRDGWLHTGDLARIDEDGYYWFAGRKKEIIVKGGANISPMEIEEAISEHPAVKEAGVAGGPHDVLGQVVHAFVVLHGDRQIDGEGIKSFLRKRIAEYKIPETVGVVPALPRGLTGKIDRKRLREMAAAIESPPLEGSP